MSIYNCESVEKKPIGLTEKIRHAFKAGRVACGLRLERLIKMFQEKSWGKVLEADGKACRKGLIPI